LGGSIELGWAQRMALPAQLDEGIGQFYVFRDYAKADKMSAEGFVTASERIASKGVGLRWQSTSGARTSIYWAKPDEIDGVKHAPTQKMYINFAMPW
jgi:hemolysin activation/secretion protein